MFINTLAAEWTKLRTTRSFWWTTALFILMGLGWAALSGYTTVDAEEVSPPCGPPPSPPSSTCWASRCS
ncbi:hypothetical protein [Corynebacterium suedekumii]|uniref:Uncharacterized protein n=1 Tax=Corynebacterium suedekumii TaxID=3049801 RepID=A0ABY8VMZ1_9CORY|nr:hypothetical protein [Corynebacterium suedekumii]WIM70722.1 hypothetical protein QP029_02510 [Corynebacterium suedekumii]